MTKTSYKETAKGRIRDTLRGLFESVTVKLDSEHRDALRILSKQVLHHWILVVSIVTVNLGASIFEGGTIAILGVAVSILVGNQDDSVFGQFGIVGGFFEKVTGGFDHEALFVVLVVTAVLAQVLKNVFTYLGKLFSIQLQYRVTRELQERVTRHFMSFSYSEVGRHPSGYTTEVIRQAQKFAATTALLNRVIIVIFMFLVYVVLMLMMSVILTLAAVAIIALIGVSLNKVVVKLKYLGGDIMNAALASSRVTFEFLNAQRLLRIFNSTLDAEKQINRSRAKTLRAMEKSEVIKAAVEPVTDAVIILGAGLFLVVGYYGAGDNAATVVSRLMLFILILNRMMPQVKAYNQARMQFANTLPVMKRIARFLWTNDKSFMRTGGKAFDSLGEEIRFENVRFRYPGADFDALKDISFTIRKGETVALVGPSGAGKSTISDLLLGLYEPTEGKILVDGEDLSKLDLGCWLRNTGVVDQEIFLLDKSVKDNIAFAGKEYTMDDIFSASKAAYAHSFILSLPDGYDTPIGDRGYRLSGGQRQRLALARALIRNPSILIMDEATSALDSESERRIQATLEELHNSRTMLLIAHRLSTIACADTIITLAEGTIVEQGTREELLAKPGIFADLWNLQVNQAASR